MRSDDCTVRGGGCGACVRGVADSVYLSSGIGYCWVKRNHPDWLLNAAATGSPFKFRNYPQTWETDYGNASYQRQWVQNGWLTSAITAGTGRGRQRADDGSRNGVAAKYPRCGGPSGDILRSAEDRACPAGTPAYRKCLMSAMRRRSRSCGSVGSGRRMVWNRNSTSLSLPGPTQSVWRGMSTRRKSPRALPSTRAAGFTLANTQTRSRPDRQYALASYLLATDGLQYPSVGDVTSKPSGAAPGAGWSSQRNVSGRGILAALFRGGCRGRKSLHVHVGGPA